MLGLARSGLAARRPRGKTIPLESGDVAGHVDAWASGLLAMHAPACMRPRDQDPTILARFFCDERRTAELSRFNDGERGRSSPWGLPEMQGRRGDSELGTARPASRASGCCLQGVSTNCAPRRGWRQPRRTQQRRRPGCSPEGSGMKGIVAGGAEELPPCRGPRRNCMHAGVQGGDGDSRVGVKLMAPASGAPLSREKGALNREVRGASRELERRGDGGLQPRQPSP
jgi:hypothetical protein